jgi:hypothetical protein
MRPDGPTTTRPACAILHEADWHATPAGKPDDVLAACGGELTWRRRCSALELRVWRRGSLSGWPAQWPDLLALRRVAAVAEATSACAPCAAVRRPASDDFHRLRAVAELPCGADGVAGTTGRRENP